MKNNNSFVPYIREAGEQRLEHQHEPIIKVDLYVFHYYSYICLSRFVESYIYFGLILSIWIRSSMSCIIIYHWIFQFVLV